MRALIIFGACVICLVSASAMAQLNDAPHKYQPHLTPQQIVHPDLAESFEASLAAYDEDLVRIARVRFLDERQQLDWLERMQQQRDVNNITHMSGPIKVAPH